MNNFLRFFRINLKWLKFLCLILILPKFCVRLFLFFKFVILNLTKLLFYKHQRIISFLFLIHQLYKNLNKIYYWNENLIQLSNKLITINNRLHFKNYQKLKNNFLLFFYRQFQKILKNLLVLLLLKFYFLLIFQKVFKINLYH